MRVLVIFSVVAAVLIAGCDRVGQRRLQVQFVQSPNDVGTILIRQADEAEALRILDGVVEPLGFKAFPEQSTNDYIRVYMLRRPPVNVDGIAYSNDVPIRVARTHPGIEIAVGEFGLLGSQPEAYRAFRDARAAFVLRYGTKHLRTKTLGSANKPARAAE